MTPLFENIIAQPASLLAVLRKHAEQDTQPLEAAAALLRRCPGRVFVTGMGASYFAATPAAYTLQRLGIPVLCMESAELLHYGSALPQQGDVAILVSRSGGSVEVVSMLPLLRERGVIVIGVSNEAESELATSSTISLVLGSAPDQMVAIQTYAATLLVLQLLAQLVAGESMHALQEAGVLALHAMEGALDECGAARANWNEWLGEAAPVYLLARGAATGTAQEGALLFHETAKASAVAMSSGQFRHGPVEVVTPEFRGIVIANAGATQRLEVGLANDLASMGAEMFWVGPEPPEARLSTKVQRMMTWPVGLAAWTAPLLEVVPLQFAAYELALLRGIRPGDFRYTPQVTTSEEGFASVAQVG